MKKSIDKIANTMNLNKQIVREIYVKSLQELVKVIEEKQSEVEYYKTKYKNQVSVTKKLRSRIKQLEGENRR